MMISFTLVTVMFDSRIKVQGKKKIGSQSLFGLEGSIHFVPFSKF